jgi:hypothetical protein
MTTRHLPPLCAPASPISPRDFGDSAFNYVKGPLPPLWGTLSEGEGKVFAHDRPFNYFIVGMTNSAPARMPVGQREVMVLSFV